jgi:hypothetical protein
MKFSQKECIVNRPVLSAGEGRGSFNAAGRLAQGRH